MKCPNSECGKSDLQHFPPRTEWCPVCGSLSPSYASIQTFYVPAQAKNYAALREALTLARQTIIRAVEANVNLPGFDPAGHVDVKAIDAALATDGGT